MIVRELIDGLGRLLVTTIGDLGSDVLGVACDSRLVQTGHLFVVIEGNQDHGERYLSEAMARGAIGVVSQGLPKEDECRPQVWIQVKNARSVLAIIADRLQQQPSLGLHVCGVTGTNGKTTVSCMVHQFMKMKWHRAGLIGTVCVDDGENQQLSSQTTPGAIELQQLLRRMVDHACRGVSMEVSSHGIDQARVEQIAFDACIFTNLTQDHLDYHGTMERYFSAKRAWFLEVAANPRGKKPCAIINVDDAYGAQLARELDGKLRVMRFGQSVSSDYRWGNLRQYHHGLDFELTHKAKSYLVRAPLIGRFNVYNIVAAMAGANACGMSLRDLVQCVAQLDQVPGRMQLVGSAAGASVYIDYAHTPDALDNACRTLRELNPGRLIVVFGCGGDRDRAKRPLMGQVVGELSDFAVVTSDNPRSESPQQIIEDIMAGMTTTAKIAIADRAEAIHKTIEASRAGDIILIAGKGHENYIETNGVKIEYSDYSQALKAIHQRVIDAAAFRESLPIRGGKHKRREEGG